MDRGAYPYAFGGDPLNPGEVKLDEPIAFLQLLQDLGVELVNFTAGSPYYNPHLTRPAHYPPSDGYLAPEDPLVGVCTAYSGRCGSLKIMHHNLPRSDPRIHTCRNGFRMLRRLLLEAA